MKTRLLRSFLLLSLGVLAVAVGVACDSATPTAPTGTVLTITASPSQISLDGTSIITVVGRRPDGNPLNEGTEIFFSTDLGNITPTVVAVDEDGIARATLRADGRAGEATVDARVSTSSGGGEGGAGTGTASVTVQIGVDPETRPTLLVSASPSTVFVNETSEITIIARNSDGSPVSAGQTIILTTTLGTLAPTRPQTGSDGTATSILDAGTQPGTAEITAVLGASEAATTSVTIEDNVSDMTIIPEPGTIPQAGGDIEVNAFVVNSQGQPVPGRQVIFDSEAGQYLPENGGNIAFTNQQGQASATLTVTREQIEDVAGDSFEVSAQVSTGEGTFLTATARVDIQGR